MPWSPQVVAAYNEYKQRAVVQGSVHIASQQYLGLTSCQTTAEQHLERARLAFVWGESAVGCVSPMPARVTLSMANRTIIVSLTEGRLSFINTYRNAYSSTRSIRTHIMSGEDAIQSGRNAVREARRNYNGIVHLPSKWIIKEIS